MTAYSLGAIALAGGKSLRMGTDKALLEINGKLLLQKICEVAADCEADPIGIVTPWQERYKSIPLPPQCQFIPESAPKSPITGFALGLSYFQRMNLKNNWILLLACDLPNLKSEVIKLWVKDLSTLPVEAIAYLPRNNKGWEPLCGFYRPSCYESLIKYIKSGKNSLQGWLSQSLVIEIPKVDPQMLFNCNTTTDYLLTKRQLD
jgi:molybdenum cofactor guanylyltransferase